MCTNGLHPGRFELIDESERLAHNAKPDVPQRSSYVARLASAQNRLLVTASAGGIHTQEHIRRDDVQRAAIV